LLGLASGKDQQCFDHVWFKEQVEQADITFDYDTYLLTAAKAKALKQAPSQPTTPAAAPTIPKTPAHPTTPVPTSSAQQVTTSAAPKVTPVVWQGHLKREQWNLFGLKVLTRLAQAEDVSIEVKVNAKLKETQILEQLNAALRELGIADPFKRD